MSEPTYKIDMLFGTIECERAAPRIEGRFLYPRGRTIERDRYGNVIRDEIRETGVCITNWEEFWYLFDAPPPPRKTWWQRLREWFC